MHENTCHQSPSIEMLPSIKQPSSVSLYFYSFMQFNCSFIANFSEGEFFVFEPFTTSFIFSLSCFFVFLFETCHFLSWIFVVILFGLSRSWRGFYGQQIEIRRKLLIMQFFFYFELKKRKKKKKVSFSLTFQNGNVKSLIHT